MGVSQGAASNQRYRTIVVDPPWPLDKRRLNAPGGPHNGNGSWGGGTPSKLPYDSMPIREIAALPIPDLAELGAHLYIWTVNAFVEQTYGIVWEWGFHPSTLLTWCKRPNGLGLGGAHSLTTEHILFARRGTCRASSRSDTTWHVWPRGKHSAKPDAFYDLVERVSPGPYAELFARRARFGWDYPIGDQALGGVAA